MKKQELKKILEEFKLLFNARINSDMCILSDYEKDYFYRKINKIEKEIEDG